MAVESNSTHRHPVTEKLAKERKMSRHSSLKEARPKSSSSVAPESPKKKPTRSSSAGKLKGKKDEPEKGRRERNSSPCVERSRSRDGNKERDRSRSAEKKALRERSLSSEGAGRRKRSQSRERSSSAERKHSRSSSKNRRDRIRSSEGTRERSKSREKSTSKREDNDILSPSTRRRRMSDVERSKRKQTSEGRKSSVLGSLDAFLVEKRPSSPSLRRDSGDRSVMSSSSKIQRRKRRSYSSGSASVFGGQVADRDEVLHLRRSLSSSASVIRDDSVVPDKKKELHKERKSSVRSRTPSLRTRHSVLNRSDSAASGMSFKPPLDYPPDVGESSGRPYRKVSLTTANGAEVPPGFPIAAVDKNPTTTSGDIEKIGNSSGLATIESTAKIRERQQRRSELTRGDGSSKSLNTMDKRTHLRRKKSLRAMTPEVPPPGSIKASHEQEEKARDSSTLPLKAEGQGSLSSRLERVGSRSPGRNSLRNSSSQSVSSTPVLADKNRIGSISRKMDKKPLTKRRTQEDVVALHDKEEDGLAEFLGMPKPDDDDEDEEKPGYGEDLNDLHSSVASLDPSILTQQNDPAKQITSILELYHDEPGGGIEGEIDLKDDSTVGTQEDHSERFKQRHGSLSHLNQSVVSFDPSQLQQSAEMFDGGKQTGPGYLSPQHSSLSGTSDSSKSPSVLKRKCGQPGVESPNSNKRVSWVELPLASPGTLLFKSTDTDGTNGRETEASVDFLSTVDDFSDEATFAEAMRLTTEQSNRDQTGKAKKNPSLGATLEQDKLRKKKQPADERTIGTTTTSNTNTSESTMKAGNKSKEVLRDSKTNVRRQHDVLADKGRSPLVRTSSSGSLSRSSRLSLRRTGDCPSDGSSGSLSRNGIITNDDTHDKSDKKFKRRPSKSTSKGNTNTGTDNKNDSPKESSLRERPRRSASDGRLSVPFTPNKTRTSVKRTNSDSKSSPAKAGSKVKYVSKSGSPESQFSGEPTNEKNDEEGGAVSPMLSLTATPSRKKSYLSRRNQTREHQQNKSSIKSSLDNFLEKAGNAHTRTDVGARSVHSEGGLKKRKSSARAKRVDNDDRSVSSAPSLTARRRSRRMSEKIAGGTKKVSSWWKLNSSEVE